MHEVKANQNGKRKKKNPQLQLELLFSLLAKIKCSIVGDINAPFYVIVRTSRQKVSKDIENLKNAINQLDLFDIYRTFRPMTT